MDSENKETEGEELKSPEALPNNGASGLSVSDTTLPNVLETNLAITSGPVEPLEDTPMAANQNSNDVRFKVKYSKDFKGAKHFTDGEVIVTSKESAELFTSKGYGSVITEKKK